MKNKLSLLFCGFLLFVSYALISHYLSIIFKPDKISKEIYDKLKSLSIQDRMLVDISDCIKTEWDSIYILGHFCDSVILSNTKLEQYGITGDGYRDCIVIIYSGKVSYIEYIEDDGFTAPPIQFYMDDETNSYLVTHKNNSKFIVCNNNNHYMLFPAAQYALSPDIFFNRNFQLPFDDRTFIEKFYAYLNGDIEMKDLF